MGIMGLTIAQRGGVYPRTSDKSSNVETSEYQIIWVLRGTLLVKLIRNMCLSVVCNQSEVVFVVDYDVTTHFPDVHTSETSEDDAPFLNDMMNDMPASMNVTLELPDRLLTLNLTLNLNIPTNLPIFLGDRNGTILWTPFENDVS